MLLRSLRLWLVLAISLGLLFSSAGTRSAAAPLQAYQAAALLSNSADAVNKENIISTADAKQTDAVYAWLVLFATDNSPEKDFQVDIKFYDPDNSLVDTQWVQGDSGKATATNSDDQLQKKQVARKVLKVKGNPAADKPGTWTVDFRIAGKSFKQVTFEMTSASNSNNGNNNNGDNDNSSDAAGAVQDNLTSQGYAVHDVASGEYDDGSGTYASVTMDMASPDINSNDFHTQLMAGWKSLATNFPDVDDLYDILPFNDRYALFYAVHSADFAANGKTWDTISSKVNFAVYDAQTKQFLNQGQTKDFVGKNFGGGNTNNNGNSGNNGKPTNTGRVGSIQFGQSPTSVKPDGKTKVNLTVTVLDKSSKPKPINDIPITFELSDPALGKLRPTQTTTDENGQATTTFTVGTKTGTVSIKASAGDVNSTVLIQIGQSEDPNQNTGDDSAAAEVKASLEQQGYNVLGAGYMKDKNGNKVDAVYVGMDPVSNQIDQDFGTQTAYGWYALMQSYPNVTNLLVVYRIDHYLMYWPTTHDAFTKVLNKQTDGSTFWNGVYPNVYVIDVNTGKQVNTKDFIQKNFGG